MWSWIAKLLKSNQDTSAGASGEMLVSDEDYEFKVGTKPTLPEGLRNLKITELRHGLLLLEQFDAELTVDQKAWDRTVEDIAVATRIYRWATSYHELAPAKRSVRLHGDNLLLCDSYYSETIGPEDDLSIWLDRMGWGDERLFEVQQATTMNPLEEGFFCCLRITVGNETDPIDCPLKWKPLLGHPPSIHGTLTEFVKQELSQPWGKGKCEEYLRACYRTVPPENLTHPVFALIDYPVFDMGMLSTTFAGSVLSQQELRFWSRPTYFHK